MCVWARAPWEPGALPFGVLCLACAVAWVCVLLCSCTHALPMPRSPGGGAGAHGWLGQGVPAARSQDTQRPRARNAARAPRPRHALLSCAPIAAGHVWPSKSRLEAASEAQQSETLGLFLFSAVFRPASQPGSQPSSQPSSKPAQPGTLCGTQAPWALSYAPLATRTTAGTHDPHCPSAPAHFSLSTIFISRRRPHRPTHHHHIRLFIPVPPASLAPLAILPLDVRLRPSAN